MGYFEEPALVLIGSGECAFHVAEQLAFDHVLRERRAVELDHRPLSAPAARVN